MKPGADTAAQVRILTSDNMFQHLAFIFRKHVLMFYVIHVDRVGSQILNVCGDIRS